MERLLITETEELKKKSIEDLPWPGRAGDGRAGGRGRRRRAGDGQVGRVTIGLLGRWDESMSVCLETLDEIATGEEPRRRGRRTDANANRSFLDERSAMVRMPVGSGRAISDPSSMGLNFYSLAGPFYFFLVNTYTKTYSGWCPWILGAQGGRPPCHPPGPALFICIQRHHETGRSSAL